MKVVKGRKRQALAQLFHAYDWNYLPDAILEGHMGVAYADDPDHPQTAALEVPGLRLHILGGDPHQPAAARYLKKLPRLTALLFTSDGWRETLEEVHGAKLFAMTRYAFTSERLDVAHLEELKAHVPEQFQIERVDLSLARSLANEKSEFAADHMLNFESPKDFVERGFGFCALYRGGMASVATTFVVCSRGIEIQVNTREEHRGQGLATAVAAYLILHSLGLGLDPNWDAASETSAALARKLGYTPQGEYPMYVYAGSRTVSVFARFGLWVKARAGK